MFSFNSLWEYGIWEVDNDEPVALAVFRYPGNLSLPRQFAYQGEDSGKKQQSELCILGISGIHCGERIDGDRIATPKFGGDFQVVLAGEMFDELGPIFPIDAQTPPGMQSPPPGL